MSKNSFYSIKNVIVVLLAAITLIMGIVGLLSDAFKEIKSAFSEDETVLDSDSYVEMFDVGQGDSILLYSNGKSALIDTGLKSYSDEVYKKLKDNGIKKLDLVLITHNHADHMGGIADITERIDVKNIIVPDLTKTDEQTDKMYMAIQNVNSSGGKSYTAKQGMSVKIGDFEITVLGCYCDEKDENDRSIITMAKIGKWKFLFTGDAQESAEKKLFADNINIDCDVLKVGHHGSMYSTSEEFLEKCSPQFAMISCGRGNRYSHPHDVVLMRLNDAGVQFWRTDLNGDITFSVTEKEIFVSTQK